jgi:endonuclease YncB( thermonuclease family)
MPVTRRRRPRRGRRSILALALALAAAAAGVAADRGLCTAPGPGSKGSPGGQDSRPPRKEAPRRPEAQQEPQQQKEQQEPRAAPPGLVLGEHRVARVVDGDTVRVDGLDASLRLIGIDAEETFKNAADRRAAEADWQGYLQQKRGRGKRPVKFGSPMGEAAKAWGVRWFEGVRRVRIERDHPAEIRDRFDRYLAYVLAEQDGRWLNYNVELVRAGMSPYFRKYGNARRFHRDFMEAEAEAKAQRRGIWEPGARAYPDYPERQAWWGARGDFVEEFRRQAEGKPDYIDITHEDARTRLADHVGREVHVLGTIDDVTRPARGPARAEMAYGRDGSFPLIFLDRDVLARSRVTTWRGEYVVVTGVPALHEHARTGEKQLQLVIERASQLRLSPVPGLTPPATRDTRDPASAAAPPPP